LEASVKRIVLVTTLILALTPALLAQNHGLLGAFFDYTRLANTSENFYGAGGRIGFNVGKHVQLEAEGAYDWEQSFTLTGSAAGNPLFVSQTATVHMVHGAFGPKVWFGTKSLHLFLTAKGGLINFSTSPSFAGQVDQIKDGNTFATFYPGGGVEAYIGPIGLRAEVGDEVWFGDRTTNSNLRISFGPQIRF
jgi:hypothetical protein